MPDEIDDIEPKVVEQFLQDLDGVLANAWSPGRLEGRSIDGVEDLYAPRGDIWNAPGGPIMVAVDRKTLWSRIRGHTGMPDPAAEGATLAEKARTRAEAAQAWIEDFDDRAQLIEALEAADLPWADVRTTATLLESPSLIAREIFAQVDDHAGGKRGVVRLPYRFSNAACTSEAPRPWPVSTIPRFWPTGWASTPMRSRHCVTRACSSTGCVDGRPAVQACTITPPASQPQ